MAKSPTSRLAKLPKPSRAKRAGRPLPVTRFTVAPKGPAIYRRGSTPLVAGGPGEPPEGFVNAHTSRDEWIYYWAIAKVLGDPSDPRKPPYVGGREWAYQSADPIYGGRISGGQVMDYVVQWGGKKVGIRLQTERWHVFASAAQQAKDFFLKTHLQGVDQVMDVYSSLGINDPSGETACRQIANALRGIPEGDPIRLGTAQPARLR